MNAKRGLVGLMAVVLVAGVAVAGEACQSCQASAPRKTEAGKPQTTCPVMGGNVDKNSKYVDVDGKRIYVCCNGCVAEVKKDPAKYIKQLEASGVVLEKAPAAKAK